MASSPNESGLPANRHRPCTYARGATLVAQNRRFCSGHGHGGAMVGNRHSGLFGHGAGTERHEAASTGHGPRFDPMVRTTPTFGQLDQWSRFRPNDQAQGTAPNGHFDAAPKTAGTARARNGHRMGTKQNAALSGRRIFSSKLLFLLDILWLRGQDLNLRPLGYEPNELPGCSTPRLNHKYSTTRLAFAALQRTYCNAGPTQG